MYAVKKGRVPGIYTNWPEAEKQVYMFPHAEHQKFDNREDAERYLGIRQDCFDIENIHVRCQHGRTVTINQETYKIDQDFNRSYIELVALDDFLQDWIRERPFHKPVLHIYVSQRHTYNVLDRYLEQWKYNLWITRHGRPVTERETLESLWTALKFFPGYKVKLCPG